MGTQLRSFILFLIMGSLFLGAFFLLENKKNSLWSLYHGDSFKEKKRANAVSLADELELKLHGALESKQLFVKKCFTQNPSELFSLKNQGLSLQLKIEKNGEISEATPLGNSPLNTTLWNCLRENILRLVIKNPKINEPVWAHWSLVF